MRTPIILVEGRDIQIFFSLEEAEAYVEPTDVEANAYQVFDATGLRLELLIEKPEGFLEPERVRMRESTDRDEATLSVAIRQALTSASGKPRDEQESLEASVAALVELFGR